MFCTSALLAPGNGISTLAMVTLICGSSSRGVTSTANRPSSRATSASSGVMALDWKAAAMRPGDAQTGVEAFFCLAWPAFSVPRWPV